MSTRERARASRGSSQIVGFDSPLRRYTAAQVTMATETAGRTDHPICPTRPDRRAAQTCAGISTGRKRKPPPIEAMSTNVTMASAHLAGCSKVGPARTSVRTLPDAPVFPAKVGRLPSIVTLWPLASLQSEPCAARAEVGARIGAAGSASRDAGEAG